MSIEEYISVQKTAAIFKVNPVTVRTWVKLDLLPNVRLGPKIIRIQYSFVKTAYREIAKGKSSFGNLNEQRPGVVLKRLRAGVGG